MGMKSFLAGRIDHYRHKALTGSWMMRRVARKLYLDYSQQQQLSLLGERLWSMRVDVEEGRRYRHDVLGAMLESDQLDRDELLRLLRVPVAMVHDSLPELAHAFADFFESLSIEQRELLRKLLNRSHLRCSA